jgi:hypothetical protein
MNRVHFASFEQQPNFQRRKTMFKTLSITLFGLLAVSAVRAQPSQALEAKIPFDFTVKNTTLEAGTYRLTYNLYSHLLRIQSRDQNGASVALIADLSAAHHAPTKLGELVFQCNGDDCHLAAVWQSAGAGGAGLKISQPGQKNASARSSETTLVTIPAE